MPRTRAVYPGAKWLKREYVTKGRIVPEIAKELDCNPHTVRQWLKACGIALRDDRAATNRRTGLARRLPLPDAEIVRLYVEERLTTTQIAEVCGTSQPTIWNHLRWAGVKLRPQWDEERRRQFDVGKVLSTRIIDPASQEIDRWWLSAEGRKKHGF